MKRRQKGFTLKDLMIVVAIIVIVVFWVNTFPRDWKRQLLDRAAEVFEGGTRPDPMNLAPLHAKIGQLALENDFLEGALSKAGLLSVKP